MSPLETVERLMPEEYHTGGLSDPDPLVRLWAIGHAMGYLAGQAASPSVGVLDDATSAAGWYFPPYALVEALSALRSQAQREADRGH